MKCSLAVGIHDASSYAATVLHQLGISSVPVDSLAAGLARGLRVFMWTRPDPLLLAPLPSAPPFAILTEHALLRALAQLPASPAARSYYFESTDAGESTPRSFYIRRPIAALPVEGLGQCYDEHNQHLPGTGAIFHPDLSALVACVQGGGASAEYRPPAPASPIASGGTIPVATLPWDVLSMTLGTEWGYRPHYSPIADRHFVQVGASVDTGALRRLIFELLIRCFHAVGLPLVRLGPRLHGCEHFSVRIDADGYSAASTASVLRAAEATGLRFTWFIDVGGWLHDLDAIRDLLAANQDVQLHCFRHQSYRSARVNGVNLRAALRRLARYGVRPTGAVSPGGRYFPGQAEAYRAAGFRYSSEFGFATDDLPAYPRNDPCNPLQVPIHNGGLHEFGDAGVTSAQAMAHWENVVLENARQNGTALIYEHPLHRLEHHEAEFTDLLLRLQQRGYEYVNMTTYADAWAQRSLSPTIAFENEAVDLGIAPHAGSFEYEAYIAPAARECHCPPGIRVRTCVPQSNDHFRYPSAEVLAATERAQRSLDESGHQSLWEWYARECIQRFIPNSLRNAVMRLRGHAPPPVPVG